MPLSKKSRSIGEDSIADAVLDRIVHTSHRIELKGESLRKKGNIVRQLIKIPRQPKSEGAVPPERGQYHLNVH
ncbi:ATP-binding protein [Sphingobacterium sp.]|uniref:ATP-binding protein n=1 Tax=Sphingobacterium sp. TaxID=341027 RepID=UPI0038CD1DEB